MEEYVMKDATVLFDAFHAVSEVKPQHLEHCIIIWENHDGKFNTQFAYYDEKERKFRDGRGGVLYEKSVRYWIPVEQGKAKIWSGDSYSKIRIDEQLVKSKAGAGREKMRLSYDTFYDLHSVRPREFTQCILMRLDSDDAGTMSIGVYEGRERGFYDVIGGHWDVTDFDFWTDIELCGKLAELTAGGEKVLREPLELKEDEDYILIDEDEEEEIDMEQVLTDDISVLFEGFHAVPEVKPQDGELCIVILKGSGDNLYYDGFYYYNEKEHCFDNSSQDWWYLDEKDVLYWIPVEQGKAKLWPGDGYRQISLDEQLVKSKAGAGSGKLKLSYDIFYDLRMARPLKSTRCILVRLRSDGTQRVSFGTYKGRERGFYDDITGRHWNVTYFDYWTDIDTCGELVELSVEGETILHEAEEKMEYELDNLDGLYEDYWDE